MKKIFNLNFCFKGSRKYVHGTDIFSELTKQYGNNVKNIDIAFHGISVKNMYFSMDKTIENDIKVTFRGLYNNSKIKLFGIENNTNITCQYEYHEEKIVENSTISISGQSIILNTPTEYTFLEHIVAMNKAMLEEIYPNIHGKWYFTRLQLKEEIKMSDIISLQLNLKSNFQFKLTKTALIVNNMEVGFIYFSLIPKES